MEYLAYIAVGVAAGLLSGFFGVGGGIILIPGLVLLLGYNQLQAQGTSLGVLLLPVTLFGFLQYYRNPEVQINLLAIVCTHGHDDHIDAAPEVALRTGAPILLHPEDLPLWHMRHPDLEPSATLSDGQVITVAGTDLTVLHTPGHSPGAVCLSAPSLGVVFTGDTLFQGGPGATGRSFSDKPTILASIRTRLLTLPRLTGRQQHRIEYRHVIWSLARKPGAFAHYRYRDELFPTLAFRRAYDALVAARPERADREYVRVLHLAASRSEAEVEVALGLLLEARALPTFQAVRELAQPPGPPALPALSAPVLDFAIYDRLLGGEGDHA
jgi:hypothetical protein